MRWFLILLLSVMATCGANTFTEFYVQTTAFNANAGSTPDDAATYSSTNGNWDGTSLYTPVDGTTPASTVTNGAWASVYLDGATVAVLIGQVTNVAAGANGAITLDQKTYSGSAPASGATGRTIKVGGAWKGPNATVGFPFGFITTNSVVTNTAVAASQLYPRVNFKSGVDYSISAAMTHSLSGPIIFQGYTTSPGDGGRATIDGGGSGAAYILLTLSGAFLTLTDFVLTHNGGTSQAYLLTVSGANATIFRVLVHDSRGGGMTLSGANIGAIECEAYACDQGLASSPTPGIGLNGNGVVAIRCISHDNIANDGSNPTGFNISGGSIGAVVRCIAYNNRGNGFRASYSVNPCYFINCDAWSNALSGIDFTSTSTTPVVMENCNVLKNGVFGINSSGSGKRLGYFLNCGFGAGTVANASGNVALAATNIVNIGEVDYASDATPWVDPTNGNFTINLAAAKSTGRCVFPHASINSPTNTLGYIDIGAAQGSDTNATVSGGSWTFSQ